MEEKKGLFGHLRDGLSKTRENLFLRVFHGDEVVDDDFFEELEESMILADMGMGTTEKLLDALRKRLREERIVERLKARDILAELISDIVSPKEVFAPDAGKGIILVVGVNGVGKTTSIGKLAMLYKKQGRAPLLAAADTFRAAAAEQLTVWSERTETPVVKHGEGADPSAVVFDAAAAFKARNCDLLIVDTAGRLHNKANLMNELAKMRRVIARELPDVPLETLLVLDATTGQNAVAQAEAFSRSADITGIILTKLDGTAKGGIVTAICDKLRIPVRFVGVGEGAEDLLPFNGADFAKAILE